MGHYFTTFHLLQISPLFVTSNIQEIIQCLTSLNIQRPQKGILTNHLAVRSFTYYGWADEWFYWTMYMHQMVKCQIRRTPSSCLLYVTFLFFFFFSMHHTMTLIILRNVVMKLTSGIMFLIVSHNLHWSCIDGHFFGILVIPIANFDGCWTLAEENL